MTKIPEYLDSTCSRDICTAGAACHEAVKVNVATGRAFITMGHPGFNSPANNRDGYATLASALAAVRRYSKAGARCPEWTWEDRCALPRGHQGPHECAAARARRETYVATYKGKSVRVTIPED